jgi:hypothetical protein
MFARMDATSRFYAADYIPGFVAQEFGAEDI